MSRKIQILDRCDEPEGTLIYALRPSSPHSYGVSTEFGAVDVVLVEPNGKAYGAGKIIRLNPDGTFYRYHGVGGKYGIKRDNIFGRIEEKD